MTSLACGQRGVQPWGRRHKHAFSRYPVAVQPAVFLDRDNTLIANDGDLGDPAAARLVDGVAQGVRSLREAGYRIVVVTNQAGVARGKFTEEDVDAVHQRIATLIDEQSASRGVIDRFYYCPYHPEASVPDYRRDHPWRKPHPGMILQASRDMGLDLSRSWMVGDQERDILAGRAAGCRTVLFSRDAELAQHVRATDVAATFTDAVRAILAHRAEEAQVAVPYATPNATARSSALSAAAPVSPPADSDISGIRRSIHELTEELRAERLRRSEFRFLTMLAGLCQLLALTLALLALLQLGDAAVFTRWILGALLAQMLVITLVVLDLRG
jgi:D,D-heptose 1,7-bisphosphate phosphatase